MTIDVNNDTPTFAGYVENEEGADDISADAYLFTDNQYIGQLQATDMDQLTYSGSGSSYLAVLADGRIQVTNGHGLSDHFANGGGSITLSVSVTDGINTVASQFVLGKSNGFLDQSQMYILTAGGTEYWPGTTAELITDLQAIQTNNDTISQLIIKGHAGPDGIQVGDDGDYLTAPSNGTNVMVGSTDITTLLKAVTDSNTSIYLRGCFSYPLAKSVQARLDGAKAYGAVRFVIGIPGTTVGFGIFQ